MAEIDAKFRLVRRRRDRATRSRAIAEQAGQARPRRAVTRRTVVRTGALALALVGVAALVAHPATRTRAEAHFEVPVPLVVNDAIRAILDQADGATAIADGRRVTVASSSSDRVVARDRALALARAGLDGARQHLTAVETQRANAARLDRVQAAAQLASLASRTGLTDPETAYRERVADVRNLQEQQAVAASTGQPLDAINARLAESQQEAFELQLQVTRHAELIQTETTASQRELEATRVINATAPAVSTASVEVSDHATGAGLGVATGVVALVIAGLALLVSELRLGRAASRGDEPDARRESGAESEDDALVESEPVALESFDRRGSRFSEFYHALAPSPPPDIDPTPPRVDLVDEEALEGIGDPEQQAAREPDGLRP